MRQAMLLRVLLAGAAWNAGVAPGVGSAFGLASPQLSTAVDARDSDPIPLDAELRARALSPEFLALIAQLDSPDFEQRRSAAQALSSATTVIEDLCAALARDNLSTEQRHRLLSVATDRVLNAPRGALGIRMDLTRPGELGVRVTGLIPGMPAEKQLEIDDLIVAIDGRALRDRDDLVSLVQGLAPGTPIRVEALRAERDTRGKPKVDPEGKPVTRRIEETFRLGSTRDLARDTTQQDALIANPVTGQRLHMARALVARFAPDSIAIPVPEDRTTIEQLSQQSPDAHPDVQSLLRWKEIVQSQGRGWDTVTINTLRSALANLKRQASDPALSNAERAWFKRVAQRYEELMPSEDAGN